MAKKKEPTESSGSDIDAAVRDMENTVNSAVKELRDAGKEGVADALLNALDNLKDVTKGK